MQRNADTSRPVSKNCDRFWIATESNYMRLDPTQGCHLIFEANVARGVFRAGVQKSQYAQAIIECHHHHIAIHQIMRSSKIVALARVTVEVAAVNVHQNGQQLFHGRQMARVDVYAQAILAHVRQRSIATSRTKSPLQRLNTHGRLLCCINDATPLLCDRHRRLKCERNSDLFTNGMIEIGYPPEYTLWISVCWLATGRMACYGTRKMGDLNVTSSHSRELCPDVVSQSVAPSDFAALSLRSIPPDVQCTSTETESQ